MRVKSKNFAFRFVRGNTRITRNLSMHLLKIAVIHLYPNQRLESLEL